MSHAWMPASPCGDGCLGTHRPPTVSPAQAAWRRSRRSPCSCAVSARPGAPAPGRQRESADRGSGSAVLLRAFGVRLEVHGPGSFQETRGAACSSSSNHVSWLDELAIDARAADPDRGQAGHQGLAGARPDHHGGRHGLPGPRAAARAARHRRTSWPRRCATAAPSASTPRARRGAGWPPGGYKPALFQAALDAGVPVRPIVLRYRLGDHADDAARVRRQRHADRLDPPGAPAARGWSSRCTCSTRSLPAARRTRRELATTWPRSRQTA